MALEAIYEQEFLSCSYGFRSNKPVHGALRKIQGTLTKMRDGCIVEIDIEDFFGALSHDYLNAFLDQRVLDGFIRRLIG